MEIYRIAQQLYAEDISGNGAKLYGGRWNSEGLTALYTSFSRSLALLETLAHTPAKMLQQKIYMLVTIDVPDTILIKEITVNKLPHGWDAPDVHRYTQLMGDQFLKENGEMILSVPSVLVAEENNYLLNPLHFDFRKIKIIHSRIIHFDLRVKESI